MLHAGVAYGYDSFFCPETIENSECLLVSLYHRIIQPHKKQTI